MEFSSQNFASPIRAFFISSSTLKFGSSFDITDIASPSVYPSTTRAVTASSTAPLGTAAKP